MNEVASPPHDIWLWTWRILCQNVDIWYTEMKGKSLYFWRFLYTQNAEITTSQKLVWEHVAETEKNL